MSAPNFSLRYNSQYLYAFLEHSDFEAYVDENTDIWGLETEEEINEAKMDSTIYSEWSDDEKDYYLNWLKEEIEKLCQYGSGYYSDFSDSPKIYDGDKVCEVRKYFNFAGGEFMVMAQIDFEAGYYEGFALDYRFTCVEGTHSWNAKFDGDDTPDAQDCEYLLEEETELNAGLRKALAPKLANKIEAIYDELTAIFEQALKTVSPYHLTGCCASNGEGFYTNHKQDTAA